MSNGIKIIDAKNVAKSARATAIAERRDVHFYCDGLSRSYSFDRRGNLWAIAYTPDGSVIHKRLSRV